MRYVTARLSPAGSAFGTAEQQVAAADSITRVSIHHVNVLDDGTVVMLEEFRGEADRLDEIYAGRSEVLAYDIAETDGALRLYVHFRANDTVTELLELPQRHGVLVDTPMAYADDGSLRITVIGTQSEIRELVADVPEDLTVGIEELGEYEPEEERLFARLTDQQRATLRLAVERGYFDVPRRATAADLAEELDVSASAVSTQLRRIERSILTSVVPDRAGPGPDLT